MATNLTGELVLESSLQCYFFDHLSNLNNKSSRPLSNETIFYSSLVMDKFGLAKEFFENSDGKFSQKVLGIKLMESMHMSREKRKRELKDIGDTALFLCGYFSDSLNRKLVDAKYYREIGQAAYAKLNSLVPSFYDVDSFYIQFSKNFLHVTFLMELLAREVAVKNETEKLLWIA